MRLFAKKIMILIVAFIATNVFILAAIPIDENAYLCEYNEKVRLIEEIEKPRMIFIGGSNIAFGINSQVLHDSLNVNIVNFGLSGGVGVKYPLVDCLNYVQKDDIVVMQFEYENYFGSADGDLDSMTELMMVTGWERCSSLGFKQWVNTIVGIPRLSIRYLIRMAKFFNSGSFSSIPKDNVFKNLKSGFNDYGDEVSHLSYSPKKVATSNENRENNKHVDCDFIEWLSVVIDKYEQTGASVVMLPPVCINSLYKSAYNDKISVALSSINCPYITSPASMVLDDRCMFNTGYHVNEEGIKLNTANIINALRPIISTR